MQAFHDLTEQLRVSDSLELRLRHEEAEIEAAGYQAEVAVLAQKLEVSALWLNHFNHLL